MGDSMRGNRVGLVISMGVLVSCGGAGVPVNSDGGCAQLCGSTCTNLATDPENCGACGHACGLGLACTNGACATGKACASDGDCADGNPCHINHCDARTATCTVKLLDKDGDGHAPIICGGDDCDDSDPTVYPGAPEICDGKDNDCNGKIDDGATCANPLFACQAGACSCRADALCGPDCVDKNTDARHCGSCGNACGANLACVNGACGCTKKMCSGMCVDPLSDVANCGGCGMACGANFACVNGACSCATQTCSGLCIDPLSDVSNCGGCGMACSTVNVNGLKCTAGQCVGRCNSGYGDCNNDLRSDGCEAALSADPLNCGACHNVCPTGMHVQSAGCANGICFAVCSPGWNDCGGVCTDIGGDFLNCGGCGMACPGGWNCCASQCSNPTADTVNCGVCGNVCTVANGAAKCALRSCAIAACNPGWADCNGAYADGCETHTDNNVLNCGACNNACFIPRAMAMCIGGMCNIGVCLPPYGDCNRLVADGCETNLGSDNANCGACGMACPSGKNCVNGMCQ
jgi:hypothetical protein